MPWLIARTWNAFFPAAGHFVLLAESGEQALLRARNDQPDVILMDVNMPDLDGFATTRRLKADAATKDIPVVFVTGKNQKADIAWGRMLGAKGYVAKPYTQRADSRAGRHLRS